MKKYFSVWACNSEQDSLEHMGFFSDMDNLDISEIMHENKFTVIQEIECPECPMDFGCFR